MRRTNTRRMAARRARPAAPRRGRPAAPRRGRTAARSRGARQMCPAGMMINAQGQCVPTGGYRRNASRRGPVNANKMAGRARGGYRKSGASMVYGGQNIINVGGVQYDCPAGVTYVGGGCVPLSYGFSQTL